MVTTQPLRYNSRSPSEAQEDTRTEALSNIREAMKLYYLNDRRAAGDPQDFLKRRRHKQILPQVPVISRL